MQNAAKAPKRVLIVAGESSGDLHGGNLIQAAGRLQLELKFYGVGGSRMREAGCEILFPIEDLAVMGVTEVLSHLPTIRDRFKRLKRQLSGADKPDLLVLIDYPGFNLRLAKVARDVGVPVLYYIGPKVWAWKKGRIKTIGQRVDRLALIFPFEPELYAEEDLLAQYVGNPLLDEFTAVQPLKDLRANFELKQADPLIGIFPGSRRSELKYSLETLLETARQILQHKPQARFILPVAPSFDPQELTVRISGSRLPIELSRDSIYEVAAACDAVVCVSGTVTLQTALCRTPMAILYKAAPLSYRLGKLLVRIPYFSLVNIVAGEKIVEEFLQDAANPQNLSREILQLLDDEEYRSKVKAGLGRVCGILGEAGCSTRVAKMAADMCQLEYAAE